MMESYIRHSHLSEKLQLGQNSTESKLNSTKQTGTGVTNNTILKHGTSYNLPHIDTEPPAIMYTHNTAIVVIMCIFAGITITITVAILVFCKKKNSVFILQKCEQESDSVYELDDMATETDVSDGESEYKEMLTQSNTYPTMSRLCEYDIDSPLPTRKNKTSKASKAKRNLNRFLSKSKSFSASQTCTNSKPSLSSDKQRIFQPPHRRDIKRPNSLALSSSLSTSQSCNNYHTIIRSANVDTILNSDTIEQEQDNYHGDMRHMKLLSNDNAEKNNYMLEKDCFVNQNHQYVLMEDTNLSRVQRVENSDSDSDMDTESITPLLKGDNNALKGGNSQQKINEITLHKHKQETPKHIQQEKAMYRQLAHSERASLEMSVIDHKSPREDIDRFKMNMAEFRPQIKEGYNCEYNISQNQTANIVAKTNPFTHKIPPILSKLSFHSQASCSSIVPREVTPDIQRDITNESSPQVAVNEAIPVEIKGELSFHWDTNV